MSVKQIARLLGATALITIGVSAPAAAVEGGLGAWLKGYGGFMAGIVPPEPGLYASDDYYYYHGSAGSEVRNGNVELGVDVTLNADLVDVLYVTDWHILGATYAAGGAVDYIWANLDASLQTRFGGREISVSNSGIGDSLLIPFLLGWNDGNLHWNVGLDVYVPTGAYSVDQPLSVGKNVWGFMPEFAVTYFDPKTGLDVSATFAFTALTNNAATDYQSGDMFNLDWAIGKHFGANGEWEAGIMGNLVHQISGDSGTGARLGPNEASSSGIGPGISYSTKLGRFPTSFTARWEHDFAAENTFKGNLALATATIAF
jgi:hypothetical protein